MSKGVNEQCIFFRIDVPTQRTLNTIRENYKFRSVAELVRTIVKVFAALYGTEIPKSAETIESEIADAFKTLENGERVFEYQKPKRRIKTNGYGGNDNKDGTN